MTDYQEFLKYINKLSERLQTHYAQHLACRAGCSGCCHHHLSVFPVEADAISAAVTALSEEMQQRITQQSQQISHDETLICPMLVDDRCAIYAARPIICRTQGLPLLLEAEDGEMEVDFCPLNFTATDATNDLAEDKLVPLDKINLQLAVLNLQHCRDQGLADEQIGVRIKMSEVILRAVTNEKI